MKTKLVALMGLAMGATFASADVFDVTFTLTGDLLVFDGFGDPDNVVINVDMASIVTGYQNFHVIGLGWDVTIFADSPSWLSESRLALQNTAQTAGVVLAPGAGDNFAGTSFYSSGGVVDLVGIALDFNLDADNNLRLEWFESFVDYVDDWDSVWLAGSSFTVRVDATPVPEPATMAVLGLGAAALLRRRRK